MLKTYNSIKGSDSQFDILGSKEIELIPIDNWVEYHNSLDRNSNFDFYSIIVVTGGSYTHTVDFDDYELNKGEILVISPNKLQQIKSIEFVEGFVICFKEEFVLDYVLSNSNQICTEMVYNFHQNNKVILNENSFQQIYHLVRIIEHEIVKEQTINQRMILQNVLSTIIIYMNNADSTTMTAIDPNVSLLLRFKILLNKDVKHSYEISYYADKLNVSVRTLQIATKKIVDMSPSEVINFYLIIAIKRLLMNMNLQIKEVAYKLEFVDSTVFSKFFKKHTGLTPNEFRKNVLQ